MSHSGLEPGCPWSTAGIWCDLPAAWCAIAPPKQHFRNVTANYLSDTTLEICIYFYYFIICNVFFVLFFIFIHLGHCESAQQIRRRELGKDWEMTRLDSNLVPENPSLFMDDWVP